MNNDRNPISRRGFVQTAALAAGTLAATDLTRAAAPAADVKIGLYSITYGGVWYRGDALTVEQVIGRAHKFGYQGVEIDGKRPHGNPLDMPQSHSGASRIPVGLYARVDAHDGRLGRQGAACVPWLAGRHAAVRGRWQL